jgi:hypothetical protein
MVHSSRNGLTDLLTRKIIGGNMTAQTTEEVQVTVASIDLLGGALRSLDAAITSSRAGEKYVAAHLAALRAAAALLAAYASPNSRKPNRGRPTSVWTLVIKVAPEFTEWAQYFAAGAGKRAAAEVGLGGAVTPREADDLVRDAHEFIDLVSEKLGVSRQVTLPTNVAAQAVIPNNVIPIKRPTAK